MKWSCSGKKKCLFICEKTGKVIARKSTSVSNCKNCWFKEMIKQKKKLIKSSNNIKDIDVFIDIFKERGLI